MASTIFLYSAQFCLSTGPHHAEFWSQNTKYSKHCFGPRTGLQVWHGVEEEQDAVFLECPLRLCRSRDRITDAWAKVQKVKRSPDGHRYIFWFVEYDDKGIECQRIWYLQGLEQVRRATIPYAKLGEDPEVVGDYASATDSDKSSETESVAAPEEEVKDELPTGSIKKRPAMRTTSSTGASSSSKGPPSARLPPWKRKEENAKQPPWKKPATSSASLKPIRRTVDTDLMYRFFTAEEAANCMRTQERPGWPSQWNPIDDPMCPAYHLWFQRDAIYSDTQEGYHVRVKFKCFDPETQMDAVRFVGTVIMSYALDNGAFFLFFLDTPQDEGRIVGVAGVEVNSTTYISHQEMRRTYHQYRGDSMRVLNVDDIEEEVEKVSDWEIYTMDGTSSGVHDQGDGLVASSMPSAEEVEWANLRMMALRMSQCPQHPDEDVEREISELQALLSQPAWSTPRACKAEPEYVDNVEDILANLQEPLRVVYNVSPAEARANLEAWREALAKELGVVSKGFRRVTCEDFRREGLEGNPKVTYVPSKVVYTIKPPDQGMKTNFKRKARIVACGNFSKDEGADLYASGASGETLRCILAEAAHRNWAAGSVDVKGAFMLTPMTDTTTTVVNPPAILVTMGLADKGEKWILTHAMYGLRQSPRLWSGFRDDHISQLRGSWNGEEIKFVQGEVEPNLWAIKAGDSICGALLVYVDDLLICGSSSLIEYVAKMIAGLWETTELEVASGSSPVRFLGCEIHDLSPGFSIDQLPYIKELLRAHGTPISQLNLVPCPREWLGGDDDQQVESTPEEVREAQRITGELLWITQRSRPDLAYHVSIMASWATRDPVRVVKIGQRVLGFLQRTAETRLELKPSGEGLSAYTDASFAPTGSRSHTGSLVMLHNCPVAWRSGRQAFTTLSSAESELVALQETYILAQAVQAVMTSFRPPTRINLYVDNMAAISLGTRNEDGAGSWRTRHLKVRSAYVRESVASGDLCLEYVPGSVQLADILTKAVPAQRHREISNMWGMVEGAAGRLKARILSLIMMCACCCTVEGTSGDSGLAIDTSVEFYVVVGMAAVTLLVFWEGICWIWVRIQAWAFGTAAESRHARRLRRLQEAVQMELNQQLAGMTPAIAREETPLPLTSLTATRRASSPAPLPSPPTATASANSSSSSTSRTLGSRALARGSAAMEGRHQEFQVVTRDASTQAEAPYFEYMPPEPAVARLEIREVYPNEYFMTAHGSHVHLHRNCWGLRNASSVTTRTLCECCRSNDGRSLYSRG